MDTAIRISRNASETDRRCSRLRFSPFTTDDIGRVSCYAAMSGSRGCDLTVGGIYMWIDYFRYTACFIDSTMFIKGVSEDDVTLTAFSVPSGLMPLRRSVALLRDYCDSIGEPLRFSAVPQDRLADFEALSPTRVSELPGWADYLYGAADLASLTGKRYNKKRNHVNRFVSDNPGWTLVPLTAANACEARAFLDTLPPRPDKPPMADYEHRQTLRVLDNFGCYTPFVGAMLVTPACGIVAFTVGEIIGDTLHLHIEKIDHRVPGAGEAVNTLFARHIVGLHPQVRWINRQDDAGDAGLRRAKESWHPSLLIPKYNIIF